MKKTVNQVQIHHHKSNDSTDSSPCQVYNPELLIVEELGKKLWHPNTEVVISCVEEQTNKEKGMPRKYTRRELHSYTQDEIREGCQECSYCSKDLWHEHKPFCKFVPYIHALDGTSRCIHFKYPQI